jgi:hypothetical protein
MCEICKSEGQDSFFLNGPKAQETTQQLYKVFKNNVAAVRLCYIHSIELFMLGEKRFLRQHLYFARALATRSKKLSSVGDSPFGF